LANIADTLSGQRTIERLSRVCERWIYTTFLCFALDLKEQKQSGFHYQYSNYPVEYSRNLIFEIGGHMDQVFQAWMKSIRVSRSNSQSLRSARRRRWLRCGRKSTVTRDVFPTLIQKRLGKPWVVKILIFLVPLRAHPWA
jgi:hypothetical protein